MTWIVWTAFFSTLLMISPIGSHPVAETQKRSIVNPNHSVRSAKDAPECATCVFTVTLLHNIWGNQILEDCFYDLITILCTDLKIEDNVVCRGVVGSFEEEFLYIIGELTNEPTDVCGILYPQCGVAFNPLNATWFLQMPPNKPEYQPVLLPTPDKPKLRVLHLSDVHIDYDYTVGAETDCGEPLCCRPANDTNERDIKKPAGYWGMVDKCDSPYWLVENALQHIADTHKDIDYILVSGDLESHAVWLYTRESHVRVVRNVTELIKRYFPSLNTYFSVGNHEGAPLDRQDRLLALKYHNSPIPKPASSLTFATHNVPEKFWMNWSYDVMPEEWSDWVPNDQLTNIQYRGSYVKQLFPGLRLISLNNGLGDNLNFYLYLNETDPDGTMSWFMDQLLQAERAGDKVHITAHIPTGNSEALEGWSINYYNIINRFENTVAGQFFGHTHNEQYKVMYLDPEDFTSRPTSVIYSAPSISTYHYYHPAYRVYTIDGNYPGSTFQVLDFELWYLNLTEANADPQNPHWRQMYSSVKEEYGMQSLAADQWNNVLERMKTDTTLFRKYVKNYYRSENACDAQCKASMLCEIRQAHHSDRLCSDLGKHLLPSINVEKVEKSSHTKEDILKRLKAFKSRDDDKCPF